MPRRFTDFEDLPFRDGHAIKAAISRMGSNLTKIAVDAGLSENQCRAALLYLYFPAGEEAIIRFFDVAPHLVFPQRYDEAGRRIIGYGNRIVSVGKRDSQNDEAA
ncbi:MAG: helix-turn-helix domain-containing protein [Magnetovibrionaceae bacterium]